MDGNGGREDMEWPRHLSKTRFPDNRGHKIRRRRKRMNCFAISIMGGSPGDVGEVPVT